MAPERITVTIRSSVGEDATLTVDDAMRQVLDLFSLLSSAGGAEAKDISWELVAVSMQSPLQVTAQATPVRAGVQANAIASRETGSLITALGAMAHEETLPSWMDRPARIRAKALLHRNLNGIGRTDLVVNDDGLRYAIDPRSARSALDTIVAFEKEIAFSEDFSRTEYGSIEAVVLHTGSFKKKPAIKMKDWLTGKDLNCFFTEELAEMVGPQKTWQETWEHTRFVVTGEITFNKDGSISHVLADNLENVSPRKIKFEDVANPNFTTGLSVIEYIDMLREHDDG